MKLGLFSHGIPGIGASVCQTIFNAFTGYEAYGPLRRWKGREI